MLLRGRDVVTKEAVEVEVADTRIQAVRPLTTPEQGTAGETGRPAIGDSECWLTPGLFDIQVNGFAGYHLSADDVTQATVQGMIEALWAVGVTRCCPTVVTGSFGGLRRSLAAIAEACDQDADMAASVAMIHIEGPYISPEDGPRGAHNRTWTRPPDWDEFCYLQEAAQGKIGLVTLAPEWPGTTDFIERLVGAGVKVSLGHHAATAEDIDAAIAAGATLCTHLGNGAHAQLPRHPNYIWEQLARDELTAGIIPDGHHLPPAVLKCFVRIKGIEQIILVSDASHLAGLAPGIYSALGGQSAVGADPRGAAANGRDPLPGRRRPAARGRPGERRPLHRCLPEPGRPHGYRDTGPRARPRRPRPLANGRARSGLGGAPLGPGGRHHDRRSDGGSGHAGVPAGGIAPAP